MNSRQKWFPVCSLFPFCVRGRACLGVSCSPRAPPAFFLLSPLFFFRQPSFVTRGRVSLATTTTTRQTARSPFFLLRAATKKTPKNAANRENVQKRARGNGKKKEKVEGHRPAGRGPPSVRLSLRKKKRGRRPAEIPFFPLPLCDTETKEKVETTKRKRPGKENGETMQCTTRQKTKRCPFLFISFFLLGVFWGITRERQNPRKRDLGRSAARFFIRREQHRIHFAGEQNRWMLWSREGR